MILINYGTTQYYEMDVGDKYYCKDMEVALRKVNEELIEEGLQPIEELSDTIVVEMNSGEHRYIYVEEIYLLD